MNIDENKPSAQERDRFILSKGHCSPALYATLAEKGYFPKEKLNILKNDTLDYTSFKRSS